MGIKLKIKVEGKKTVPLEKLNSFQEDIKSVPKERYEELRASLLKYGITFALHVWFNKGKYYLIDGHQRVFTLNLLKENEGVEVPDIPVAVIQAKSFGSS